MKVGVLTFHHVYNYGALLQAYATQTVLEEAGYEAEIVNVRPFRRDVPEVARKSRWLRPVFRMGRALGLVGMSQKTVAFDGFRDNFLKVGRPYRTVADYLDGEGDVHGIVVGSDQVWDPRYGKHACDTYLLSGIARNIRRVSYAACCGSEMARIEKLAAYREDIRNFDALSVRDVFTQSAITQAAGAAPELVVDPTLLIDWEGVARDRGCAGEVPDDFIFYYGFSPNGDEAVSQLAVCHDIPVVGVGMENDAGNATEMTLLDGVGPQKWVDLVRRSRVVVTKSFHGVMFALKFGKPVLVVPANERSASRLEDAAARFGVEKALVGAREKVGDVQERLNGVDWDETALKVNEAVDGSRAFLVDALRGDPKGAVNGGQEVTARGRVAGRRTE